MSLHLDIKFARVSYKSSILLYWNTWLRELTMASSISPLTYESFIALLDQGDQFTIEPSSFDIISAVRYDPTLSTVPPTSVDKVTKSNLFLFPEHIERLKFSFNFFQQAAKDSNPGIQLSDIEIDGDFIFHQIVKAIEESQVPLDKPLKVRIVVSIKGSVEIILNEATERPNLLDGLEDFYAEDQRWDVYVDRTPILVSPFTSFKTTRRDVQNNARRSLPGKRPGKEEVLLTNSAGEVMEGSITNVAFKNKAGQWTTPQLTSGCLCGVARHFLLRKDFVKEGNIPVSELKIGQDVLLLNGIQGAVRGTIVGFVGE